MNTHTLNSKTQLLPLLGMIGGVIAFVLRLMQNRTGFEAATGLPVPGNLAGILLIVWLVITAAAALWLAPPKARQSLAEIPFAGKTPRWTALPIAGSLLIALAGLADLLEGTSGVSLLAQLKAAADPYAAAVEEAAFFAPSIQLLLGLLSLASGAGLFLTVVSWGKGKLANNVLLLLPPVMLVIRLAIIYRLDSMNPSLEAYYIELLALVCLTMGFFRLSAFGFRLGQTRSFSFWVCETMIICCAALADGGPCLSSLLLYIGGASTLAGFLTAEAA